MNTTYYIEQYRHMTDHPTKFNFAEAYSFGSLQKALRQSANTHHITVCYFRIKLKTTS